MGSTGSRKFVSRAADSWKLLRFKKLDVNYLKFLRFKKLDMSHGGRVTERRLKFLKFKNLSAGIPFD